MKILKYPKMFVSSVLNTIFKPLQRFKETKNNLSEYKKEYKKLFFNKRKRFKNYEDWAAYMGINQNEDKVITMSRIKTKLLSPLILLLVFCLCTVFISDFSIISSIIFTVSFIGIIVNLTIYMWWRYMVLNNTYISFIDYFLRNNKENQ